MNSNQEKDNEILKLSKIIQVRENKIIQCKQNEEEAKKEINRLQQCLNTKADIEHVLAGYRSWFLMLKSIITRMQFYKKIADRRTKSQDKKTQEVINYKQSFERMIQEIEDLKQCLENTIKVGQKSRRMPTGKISAVNSKNATKQSETSSQIKAH